MIIAASATVGHKLSAAADVELAYEGIRRAAAIGALEVRRIDHGQTTIGRAGHKCVLAAVHGDGRAASYPASANKSRPNERCAGGRHFRQESVAGAAERALINAA